MDIHNTIIVDTREKPHAIAGILDYFERNGIQYEKKKLDYGDYMLKEPQDGPKISIDRKQNIAELAKNCTRESERFRREMDRAAADGAKLVILVEQNRYSDRGEIVTVRDISDLIRWSSPHTMVRGEKVFRVLNSWTKKWPISVEFCSKRSTGRIIKEILLNQRIEPQEGEPCQEKTQL